MGSIAGSNSSGTGTPGVDNGSAVSGQVHVQGVTDPFFYHPSADPIPHYWEIYGIYERANEVALGEAAEDTEQPLINDLSRCFNCGDPDHKVTECRFRLNRELIALSRQYYQFHSGTLGLGNWQRIHAVEAWRQLRLDWLEEFEPGKIKGDLLREALESSNEEWLRNISVWGYPPGWMSKADPRERVRKRIWNEVHGDVDEELDDMDFEIHGDEDYVEKVAFRDAFQITSYIQKIESEELSEDESSVSDSSGSTTASQEEFNIPSPPIRWAHYPPSYFSSQHLVPYVPPPPAEPWSTTSFANTEAYLNQYNVYHNPPPPSEEPPPLPPSSTPPPLPPSNPLPTPPPLHILYDQPHAKPSYPQPAPRPSTQPPQNGVDEAELSECDMDLSDSD